MVTAVDTSVLLDVLLNDVQHAPASMAALRRGSVEGSLIVCEIVLAELTPTLAPAEMPQFLADWNLTFVPSSQASALLAGEMFRVYLQRGGQRNRVVPDFLLAAHAQTHAQRLLARDRGYYRDYFKQLQIGTPQPQVLIWRRRLVERKPSRKTSTVAIGATPKVCRSLRSLEWFLVRGLQRCRP